MGRVLLALAVLAIGLGIGLATRETETQTLRITTVEVVNGSSTARPELAPIPTRISSSTSDPRSLAPSAAAPLDASILSIDYVLQPPQQLIVTWMRTGRIWSRYGYAIWQRSDDREGGRWDRVAASDQPANNTTGVHAYSIHLGDVSGDERPEVLVFEDHDGSAGCGVYHLFATGGNGEAHQALRKELCIDGGTVGFGRHRLVLLEGFDYYTSGAHCCYRRVRETWLRWDGRRLATVHRAVRKNDRGWPPG